MTTEDPPELPPGFTMPDGSFEGQPQESGEALRARLLSETARAPWRELQRFFAQGIVLMAQPGVDLIEVGMALAEDDSARMNSWLSAGVAGRVSDDQAVRWYEGDATLWTMVVKPWVLVQEVAD